MLKWATYRLAGCDFGIFAARIARIAAAQHPHPVIVRLSDFKTNEYAALIGGEPFEEPEHQILHVGNVGHRNGCRRHSKLIHLQ